MRLFKRAKISAMDKLTGNLIQPPAVVGQKEFTSVGTFSWVVPAGATCISRALFEGTYLMFV